MSWCGTRERSTGPKTDEGKAVAARNADRGGERQELRALACRVDDVLRAQRDCVAQAGEGAHNSRRARHDIAPVSSAR